MIASMTPEEYFSYTMELCGICRACGEFSCGPVEPDARNYPCEDCGEREVFGVEELMMMGEIEIVE